MGQARPGPGPRVRRSSPTHLAGAPCDYVLKYVLYRPDYCVRIYMHTRTMVFRLQHGQVHPNRGKTSLFIPVQPVPSFPLPCTHTPSPSGVPSSPFPNCLAFLALSCPCLFVSLELVGSSLVLFPLVSALLIPHPHQPTTSLSTILT